jgi:3D (Asp-Asp-Asp) domain-containing protein
MDYDIPEYLRRPSLFARERAAAKKAARHALMRDILTAIVVLIALALTITLAVISAIPTPEAAYAQELPRHEAPAPKAAPIVVPAATRAVAATVTAYSSSPDETDDTPFIAANGGTVHHGTLACPDTYKFGTKVVIEGTTYTCEDRMNARYRGQERFDIWKASKAEALSYGTKQITIQIAL